MRADRFYVLKITVIGLGQQRENPRTVVWGPATSASEPFLISIKSTGQFSKTGSRSCLTPCNLVGRIERNVRLCVEQK